MSKGRDIRTAYSLSGRSNSHYNMTAMRLNQFKNPNLMRLQSNYDQKLSDMRSKQRKLQQKQAGRPITRKEQHEEDARSTTSLGSRSAKSISSRAASIKDIIERMAYSRSIKTRSSIRRVNSEARDIDQIEEVEENIDEVPQETPKSTLIEEDAQQDILAEDENQSNATNEEKAAESAETSIIVCILDDPNCPPVPANAHYNNLWFCHLCSCGKHICPGKFGSTWLVSSNQFKTTNLNTYKDRGLYEKPTRAIEQQQIMKSRMPMEGSSTARESYKVPPIALTTIVENKPITRDVKFVATTSNQSTYPNWGPYKPESNSPVKLPYRGGEVKLDGRSSYGESYKPSDRATTIRTIMSKNKNQLNFGTEFYGSSTARESFKSFDKEVYANREPKKIEKPTDLVNIPYRSMKQQDFLGHQPQFRFPKIASNPEIKF